MNKIVCFGFCAFALAGSASAASDSNSCSNVGIKGTYDGSGLHEYNFGLPEGSYRISAVGTFRIAGEEDEHKQPMFNLAEVGCEPDTAKGGNLECKITEAVVWANKGKPDSNNPNCMLDLTISTYPMKELQKGVLTGMESFNSSACYNTTLTIDRNAKRIYLSFVRTKEADNYDKIAGGTCGNTPRTQVLMNCTSSTRSRKGGKSPPRHCDFSSSEDH